MPGDAWFSSHHDVAAGIVVSLVPPEALQPGNLIVDFGCGDGITALGVACRVGARVVGVDLHRTFDHLPALAETNLGSAALPRNLAFRQTALGEALPFRGASVDLVYSWSVFEHVARVEEVVADLHRIVRGGGHLFIQIEPLFYSAYGSHLRRLVDEPWAHLLHDEDEFLAMARGAGDHVAESERDVLYRTHEFEEVKRQLLREYGSLNRITADELAAVVRDAGFRIVWEKRLAENDAQPPARLTAKYPRDLLMTNQLVLLAEKLPAS